MPFGRLPAYVSTKVGGCNYVRRSLAQMIVGKINVWSSNKQSKELHTVVSVAFSYLLQCRVKTGGKLLLFIILQRIQQKGEELRDRTIGS